jgi:hypothetical protein
LQHEPAHHGAPSYVVAVLAAQPGDEQQSENAHIRACHGFPASPPRTVWAFASVLKQLARARGGVSSYDGGARQLYAQGVDILTIFGLFAVSAMLVCYAFEDRSPWWILGFAAACALGSVYGFLQGAWPFGLVEAVWSMVALRRWRSRRSVT